MNAEPIFELLKPRFPNYNLEMQKGDAGDPWILIESDGLIPVISYLKTDLHMNYLAVLGGMDSGSELGVFYVLRSIMDKSEINLKVLVDKSNPEVPSISSLYASANWFERETFDLFGIHFSGHPDLRRLMMPSDWEGHPLRKDYVYPTEYHGIQHHRPDAHELFDSLKSETLGKGQHD